MKIKPTLISVTAVFLLAGTILFIHSLNKERPGKEEVNQFLNGFNSRVREGNVQLLLSYFEMGRKTKTVKQFVNLLAGKKDIGGTEQPIANISLVIDSTDVNIIDHEWVTANIPVKLSHGSDNARMSVLTLRIHKIAPHIFKIRQADTRQFLKDYAAYEDFVRSQALQ